MQAGLQKPVLNGTGTGCLDDTRAMEGVLYLTNLLSSAKLLQKRTGGELR